MHFEDFDFGTNLIKVYGEVQKWMPEEFFTFGPLDQGESHKF